MIDVVDILDIHFRVGLWKWEKKKEENKLR